MHGGDIYRNCVSLDFSVNVNPLGTPETVKDSLHKAVALCGCYPDIHAKRLKQALCGELSLPETFLAFGNGASELFPAIAHAVKPGKTLIPVPSFSGYERAVHAAGGNIRYLPLKRRTGYLPGEDLLEALSGETDLLFLANPNNPTGRLVGKEYLIRLLDVCRRKNIRVVLDECFIEFCGEGHSLLGELKTFDNLLLVRAFTKIFAIPGVRLGYLACSDTELVGRIREQLPEWNLSVFAQEAGLACMGQETFLRKTAAYVREERRILAQRLSRMGFEVFPGEANFILFYSEKNLFESLLQQGILIRDCENFRGLSKGFYRVAVRSRQDNERLAEALERV